MTTRRQLISVARAAKAVTHITARESPVRNIVCAEVALAFPKVQSLIDGGDVFDIWAT
jgi:hypothetical protein